MRILLVLVFLITSCSENNNNNPSSSRDNPDRDSNQQNQDENQGDENQGAGQDNENQGDATTSSGNIFEAIANCDIESLSNFEIPPSQMKDKSSYSPLIRSIKEDCIEAFEHLILRNVDVNEQDGYGYTALHWAVHHLNADVINELLLSPNVNPNIQDLNGVTALVSATKRINTSEKEAQLVDLLLKFPKTDLNRPDMHGKTAIMYAVSTKKAVTNADGTTTFLEKIPTVQKLLSTGRVILMLRDEYDFTALDLARSANHHNLVRILTDHN